MEPGANPSVRPPRPPDEVIAERQECVRGDYIALMPDARIVAKWARAWKLSRRTVTRYLASVKVRWRREHASADEAEHERVEAIMLEEITGLADLVRRCIEADDRKNEIGARKARIYGAAVYSEKRGLQPAKRVEISKADPVAAMSPEERRTRALRHARKLTETSATKGEA